MVDGPFEMLGWVDRHPGHTGGTSTAAPQVEYLVSRVVLPGDDGWVLLDLDPGGLKPAVNAHQEF